MGKIQLLDPHTIDQIAAGEVIEQPSSVIKELVENAIDAKASKILIEIISGGQALIAVQDNGSGMNAEDALLSISRHATSKLRTIADLNQLSTMGFRGEALSSIASISEFSLATAEHGNQEVMPGTILTVHGGKVLSQTQTTCLPGTRIEVRSLFYNTPARKKFQKAPQKDAQEVRKLFTQLALSYPDIDFTLIVDQKKESELIAATLEERIRHILGSDFASELKPLEATYEGLSVKGFIGQPRAHRPNRTGQYLFINKRQISSLAISYAVRDGYGNLLQDSHYPIFVLHLEIDPHSIDVNVHPQKKELRFRSEESVKKALVQAVQQLFFKRTAISMQKSIQKLPDTYVAELQQIEFIRPKNIVEEAPLLFVEPIQIMGFFDEYILVRAQDFPLTEEKEGVIFIDGKAALSRIAFEDFLIPKKSAHNSQRLLTPIFIELSKTESRELLERLPILEKIGFEIRQFGAHAFLIEAITPAIETSKVSDFLKTFLAEELTGSLDEQLEQIAKMASTLSHAKTTPFTRELAQEIVKKLLTCNEPTSCPFGNPIFMVLTKEEIQKRFTYESANKKITASCT